MQHYHEPERSIPIVRRADVLVAGAGPAGIAAAVAAGRAGAKTVLLETNGCLGGVWTAGLFAWVLDHGNKVGLLQEIFRRLDARSARQPSHFGGVAFDVEEMKRLLEQLCLEAGVEVQLHTRVCAAALAERRLAMAITESKSGREAWAAHAFIDATGDGDLAARAGCAFALGHPDTGKTQPMSLLALLGGVHYQQIQPYVHDASSKWREDTKRLIDVLARHGVEPSYGAPVLFKIHDDLYAIMANHEYGHSALDARAVSTATINARAELHRIVDALRAEGGAWSNLKLVATAAQIGTREGRRIRGRYTVTVDDLLSGAQHDDAVCRVTFPVDVHALDPSKGKSYDKGGVGKTQPYDIPLRALIAADVDGLLMAGRCISGDFLAHASYRVTGNAVAMGQAAGTTAALAARSGRLPHEVPWPEVQGALAAVRI